MPATTLVNFHQGCCLTTPDTGTDDIHFLQVIVTSLVKLNTESPVGQVFITYFSMLTATQLSVFTNNILEKPEFCTQSMQGWDGVGTSQTPPLQTILPLSLDQSPHTFATD